MNYSRSGRPSTTRIEERIQRVNILIREGRRITLAEVAAIEGISYGSAKAIGHDDMCALGT